MSQLQVVIHGFSAAHVKVVGEIKTELHARAGVRILEGSLVFPMKTASNKVQSQAQIFGDPASLDDAQKKALKRLIEEVLIGTARRHGLRHEFMGALFMP